MALRDRCPRSASDDGFMSSHSIFSDQDFKEIDKWQVNNFSTKYCDVAATIQEKIDGQYLADRILLAVDVMNQYSHTYFVHQHYITPSSRHLLVEQILKHHLKENNIVDVHIRWLSNYHVVVSRYL